MHEMPVVLNVVHAMDSYAEENGISDVRVVVMEIGESSGVVPFFFRSCWEAAIGKSTHLMNSALDIIEIANEAKCNECTAIFHPESLDKPCPHCSSQNWTLQAGHEIRIKEIQVDT